ncbi:MAG: glycoside hydrolase family 3 protein [Candidatus Wildermuthbacteria bacterium]|nr:glycoside hydrolase family 3 protein [Candidatus Wildermuthbacteria bacterium]
MKGILLVILIIAGMAVFFRAYAPEETLQNNLGQMLIIGFEGKEATPEVRSLIEGIRPGGVLLLSRNIESKEQTKKLIEDLQKVSLEATGLKLFVAVDQEGGIISRLPFAEHTSQSDLQDYDQALLVGAKRAEDLQEVGVNMNLAPVLDSLGLGDFLFPRSFKKNYVQSLEIAEGLILGQQQENIIAVPKHFPGYGAIASNPEENEIPSVSHTPDVLIFASLFHKLQLPFVMVSHVVYEDMDSNTALPFSAKGIEFLRQELGDSILVMSDDILSPAFLKKFSYEEIGANAIKAGVNVMIAAGYPDANIVLEFYEELAQEVRKDKELASLVKKSAERIIEVKKEMLR